MPWVVTGKLRHGSPKDLPVGSIVDVSGITPHMLEVWKGARLVQYVDREEAELRHSEALLKQHERKIETQKQGLAKARAILAALDRERRDLEARGEHLASALQTQAIVVEEEEEKLARLERGDDVDSTPDPEPADGDHDGDDGGEQDASE